MVESLAHRVTELTRALADEQSARLAIHERLIDSERARMRMEMKLLEVAAKVAAVDRLAGQVCELRARLVRAGIVEGEE